MRLRNTFITSILILTLFMPVGQHGWQTAEAQLGLGGISAERVHIVADTAETTIKNTLNTALIEARTALSGLRLDGMEMKEKVLDPIAWNMAKQLQQQLTGNLLKWIGGQLPGQNGQVPFVQSYGDHYENIFDAVAGELLSGNQIGGLCSPEEDFQVKERVYYSYVQSRGENEGQMFQCPVEEIDDEETSALDRLLYGALTCSGVTCAGYKAEQELIVRQVNAYANEKQVLDYSRGWKAQRVCRGEGGNSSSTICELVNPPSITSDAVSFQLVELPGLQMLQTDEFNEVVSNLMSNLTNQALTGLTGVLGLSGNPTYSMNVFGEGGNLSYVDAMAADDISRYQTPTANPISEALDAAIDFETMLDEIMEDIEGLEAQIASDTAEFRPCFDLTLTPDLIQAKNNASSSLAVASTSIAILTVLDLQYASSTSASERGAIMSTFMSYQNQGLFRTAYENSRFRVTFLEYTFAQMVDKFKYDIAIERVSCGGSFNYVGTLPPPSTATTTMPREGP